MNTFTIKVGRYCPVCGGMVLSECEHPFELLVTRPTPGASDSPGVELTYLRARIEELEDVIAGLAACEVKQP